MLPFLLFCIIAGTALALLTYAISWAFMIPVALSEQGWVSWQVPHALYYFAPFGPMIAAIIVTAFIEGRNGVSLLLSRLLKWRVRFGYFAFAVLVPIGLFVLAVLVNRLVTGNSSDLSFLGEADYMPYLSPLGVLGLWLLTYGMGEETGWRGFALPHLQRNRTAASATLILAVFWAGWHLPAFFFCGCPGDDEADPYRMASLMMSLMCRYGLNMGAFWLRDKFRSRAVIDTPPLVGGLNQSADRQPIINFQINV